MIFITELFVGFNKASLETGRLDTVKLINLRHPDSMPPLSSKGKVMHTHLKPKVKSSIEYLTYIAPKNAIILWLKCKLVKEKS